MLTKLKTEGAVSNACHNVKKGNKGRLEFSVKKAPDGYACHFHDVGNYGSTRWEAVAPMTEEDLDGMIERLTAIRAGIIDDTFTPAEFETVVDAEPVEEDTVVETVPVESSEYPSNTVEIR